MTGPRKIQDDVPGIPVGWGGPVGPELRVLGKYYLDDLDIIDKPKIGLIGLLYHIQQ